MSDEYVQEGEELNEGQSSLAALLQAGVGGRQALIMTAYIEEMKKWNAAREETQKTFKDKCVELNYAYYDVETEKSWKKFLFHKILRRKTSAENKVDILRKEVELIVESMIEHERNKPDPVRYELAAIGNNLFKPR